ncbi:MAG: hypothetical protein EBX40_07545 [Gammaproteobacteria bacterium]|nr:hypothetical protein [Gammaproteobacteria bacterium]
MIEATQKNTASEEQVRETTEQLVNQTQENLKPDEAATMVFKYYWPQYRTLVSKLSNKDARRLNEALVGFPLEVTDKNFYSMEAKEAFKLAKTLMDAKFILQQKVISEAISKLETKTETVNEGENNNG